MRRVGREILSETHTIKLATSSTLIEYIQMIRLSQRCTSRLHSLLSCQFCQATTLQYLRMDKLVQVKLTRWKDLNMGKERNSVALYRALWKKYLHILARNRLNRAHSWCGRATCRFTMRLYLICSRVTEPAYRFERIRSVAFSSKVFQSGPFAHPLKPTTS